MINGKHVPKFKCPNCLPKPKSLGFRWKKALLGVRNSTNPKKNKYPRKIRMVLYFFSYFYPPKVFKNTEYFQYFLTFETFMATADVKLTTELFISLRSFLYIRFLPCDSIIRQKRATCHTGPVVIMYTRQKFSTPALSRHPSWTHNGVKKNWIHIVVSYKIGCHLKK